MPANPAVDSLAVISLQEVLASRLTPPRVTGTTAEPPLAAVPR